MAKATQGTDRNLKDLQPVPLEALEDLKQIFNAVDEDRLQPTSRQVFQQILKSLREGRCRDLTGWEGIPQILVPLPPLEEARKA